MKQTIKLTESELKRLIKENLKQVLNEDYDGENQLWNRAKELLDCKVMLEALEHYLNQDGLLDEYANRLSQDFDLRTSNI